MTSSAVEAIWIWYYGGSNQKWTYGRFGEGGFTKDHLQINASAAEAVKSIYGLEAREGQLRELRLVWPGGGVQGKFMYSAGRFVLRWERSQTANNEPWSAPEPWRMIAAPNVNSVSPLRGEGRAINQSGALAAIEEFNATNSAGYLLAIKLKNEDETLHVRSYLENPESDLEFASTELLPASVRRLAGSLNPSSPSCVSQIMGGRPVDEDVEWVISMLAENPNLLLTGPPGTGKTVLLDKIVQYVTCPDLEITFDPAKVYDAWGGPEEEPVPGKAATVVLHPSYSYENLVVGLLPKMKGKNVEVGVTTGPLVNLAHFASSGARALLVLDEFNRGNAAAVLGDSLALLDKDKRGVAHVDLPAYGLTMEVPEEYSAEGNKAVDARFTLPPSLWIVAAMNSSDRSVAPLDAALRRRFSIVEVGPDYEILGDQLGADLEADLTAPWEGWTREAVARLAVELIREINSRIEVSLGRDFLLGHSNFWHVGGGSAEDALFSLASAWDLRVVQTMRLALQDDDDTLAFILKAGKSSDAVNASKRAVWWKRGNPAHDRFARPILCFNNVAELDLVELQDELKRLAGI